MQAPFGTWTSPISAKVVATAANGLLSLAVANGKLYWLEMRPGEGGRYVLVKGGQQQAQEVVPGEFNVRSRVHEYGGGSYLPTDDALYFTNFADQALYQLDVRSSQATQATQTSQISETPLTRLTISDKLRYADCDAHPVAPRLVCVREDHRGAGDALNQLVQIDLQQTPQDGTLLWGEDDFVAYPRYSADGKFLAWISWEHPNMPWDNVKLWVAQVADNGQLRSPTQLNIGVNESVLQPTWAADGTLYFLADRSGWWNLHRWQNGTVTAVHKLDAELGDALWTLGNRYFALTDNHQALVVQHGVSGGVDGQQLALLSLDDGNLTPIKLPFVSYHSLAVAGGSAWFIAGRSNLPAAVVALDLASQQYSIVHESGRAVVADAYIASARPVTFPTPGGEHAHAWYYPPQNDDFTAPPGELPPLLVVMHGGPTGATSPAFNIAKQFWTSRGIAVLDINYRGSTGYGRAYRNRLRGEWGVVDVQDAIAATQYAVQQGLADPKRLLIRGGSAGGFTTLAALAASDVFAAGANYYGVSDLEVLAQDTHKFESRYLDSLIGPYPQAQALYQQRSPINDLSNFDSPLITLQGLEDQIVLPNQSEMIYQALMRKGVPAAYLTYPGEQHGFRQAASIISSLQAELYFYGRVLGFTPAGELPPVEIVNLK